VECCRINSFRKVNDQEKRFLGKAKDLLDESIENLNHQTRERLEYVRINALRSAGKEGHHKSKKITG